MSGLEQGLGLGQGVGSLSTSLLNTGVFTVPALAALIVGDNSLRMWPLFILLIFPIAVALALLGRHSPSAGSMAHLVDMAFGPCLASATGWLFLSITPVELPAALHIVAGSSQALSGWHDAQLLLAELGILAIIWRIGSRGASSSVNLQTLVVALIVALIVAVWWRDGINPAQVPFLTLVGIDHGQLFFALSVMFWCSIGLEVFTHLTSELKRPERDFSRALIIGLLLVGSVYWAYTTLVLHLYTFDEEIAAAVSLPNIVVRLFGVGALQVACVIDYLACFASLNTYIQSLVRLVWSQAQHKPESYLARLPSWQIPRNALDIVLGSCMVNTLCIYLLDINLGALIVYANGILIMICPLCMLVGCRLLHGRYRLLAAMGGILCLLLLAIVGWKSLCALVMLAGLWLFLPGRKLATGSVQAWKESGPVVSADQAGRVLVAGIVLVVQTITLLIPTLEFPFEGLTAASTGTKAAARHPAEAQMRH